MKKLEKSLLPLTPDELYDIYGVYIKRCKDGWLPMKGVECYQPYKGWSRGSAPIKMWDSWIEAANAVLKYEKRRKK